MMKRRACLVALIVAGGCGPNEAPKKAATPAVAETPGGKQQSASVESKMKIPRVAILVFGTRSSGSATAVSLAPLLIRDRLTELGYVDGKTILFEESYADGDALRLAQLAREIVEKKPDVIVAIAAAATAAARQATGTI